MMNKTEVCLQNFDIEQIADSGQCFRMKALSKDCYQLIAGDACVEIRRDTIKKDKYIFFCSEEEFHKTWFTYFDLDTDYAKMKEAVEEDDIYMQNAIRFGSGIRILRQNLWEMIITFIISTQNNIPRIKKIVEALCEKYGQAKESSSGEIYYAFPTVEALAKASLEDLSSCNTGYRNKYILKTAQIINSQPDLLKTLSSLNYDMAKKELMKLHGVGKKVAECICLYGLHHIEAFPIDTHVQYILTTYYPKGFPFKRYEGFAGVLQQYAFYYDLQER